jgi:hypothetical protein
LPVKKAVRAHGNAMEHVAIFAPVVLALELAAAPAALLAALVATFSISRYMHPFGMLGQAFWARRSGAAITFLCELVGVIALLPVVLMN